MDFDVYRPGPLVMGVYELFAFLGTFGGRFQRFRVSLSLLVHLKVWGEDVGVVVLVFVVDMLFWPLKEIQ